MKKRYIYILLLIIFASILLSSDKNEISKYQIYNYGKTDGLPSESINDITQTSDGYLWIGTSKGLVRFDGIDFNIIKINTNQKRSEIYVLFIDRNNILWIGSSSGLTSINGDRILSYSSKDGFPVKKVTCLNEDLNGNLWIGTSNSNLYCFKDNKFYLFDKKKGISASSISSVFEDDQGDLWVSAFREGLYKKEKNFFKKIKIGTNFKEKISLNFIFKKRNNQILLGTSKGLFELNENKVKNLYSIANGLLSNDIIDILEDYNGDLWIATLNGVGLVKKDFSKKNDFTNYLNFDSITSLYKDKEENIWVGTNGSGLKKFSTGAFKTFSISEGSSNIILSIYEDNKGYKWFGTPLGIYNNKNGSIKEYLIRKKVFNNTKKPNWIRTIHEDKKNNLWFGTASNGIVKVNQKNEVENLTINNGLVSNNIFKIFCDKKNNLWIGTDKGLSLYNRGVFTNFSTKNGLLSNQINHILEDFEDNLWISGDFGVNVFKNGNISSENLTTYLPGISVSIVYEDRYKNKSIYWIGTFGSGLKMLDKNSITHITKKNGLPSNNIYQILKDKKNNYWLSCDMGVITIKKDDIDKFITKKKNYIKYSLFGISNGMKNIQCSKYNNNSAIKIKNGDFWFATANGISVVNPSTLKINKLPPSVIINELHINGQRHDLNEKVFKVRECLHFRFTAPSFTSPEKIKFKYKLDGYDKDWKTSKSHLSRTAHYINPPPGKYCFRVTACNSNGVWNKKGSSFAFTIKPFYYQYKFFWLWVSIIFLFAIIGFTYTIKKYLNYRKNKKKYKHSTLDSNSVDKHIAKLLYLLENEKIYKRENISLQNLAAKLLIPPTHLSQIINEKLNKTFFDLINSYRIEEAKKQLLNSSKLGKNILEIAYDVGFNSQAAFYRAFKKNTGISPSKFKKSSH